MTDSDRIRALAVQFGFADIASELASAALPSIRLVPRGRAATLGSTKIGGAPDLPRDLPWPSEQDGGGAHPLTFVAQIHLDELHGEIWPNPHSGILYFFADQDWDTTEVRSATVLHVAPTGALAARATPELVPDEFVIDETAVVARPEITLPQLGVWPAQALLDLAFQDGGSYGDKATRDAYLALMERVAALPDTSEYHGRHPFTPEHRMLGWPRHIQGDVLLELVAQSRVQDGRSESHAEIAGEAHAWRLLLQLTSASGTASFGDALYFGIRATDLAAGRFDRVQATSQY